MCVVCCEPLVVYCVGECDHRSLCMKCALRLRLFYEDKRCPVCKVRRGAAWGSEVGGRVAFLSTAMGSVSCRRPAPPEARPLCQHQGIIRRVCFVCILPALMRARASAFFCARNPLRISICCRLGWLWTSPG
jgi:hypothetical protein